MLLAILLNSLKKAMSKRTEQVSKLLRQEINNILIKDFEPPAGTLISVADVTVAPDLKKATAYLSVIPENKIGSSLEIIKKFGRHIQHQINHTLKMQIIPQIEWKIDERSIKYQKIEDALKQ